MIFYILAGISVILLMWAHVTLDEYITHDHNAVNVTFPLSIILVCVVGFYIIRRHTHTHNAFMFVALCIVCVVVATLGILLYLVGMDIMSVAALSVFSTSAYTTWRMSRLGIQGIRVTFRG